MDDFDKRIAESSLDFSEDEEELAELRAIAEEIARMKAEKDAKEAEAVFKGKKTSKLAIIIAERRKRKREKRNARYEKALTKDIRYRGPLSYRYLKIIGWLLIIAMEGILFLKLGAKFDGTAAKYYNSYSGIMNKLSYLILPCLLMANFAIILDRKIDYKSLIRNYFILVVVFYFAIYIVYNRYLLGVVRAVTENDKEVIKEVEGSIAELGSDGKFSFNIFVDLFLCSLIMFFMNYYPKKHFQGRKRVIFRSFALIPIAYEFMSIVLKILAFEGKIRLPAMVYPLLTTKPPVMLFFFITLVLFIKNRERKFLNCGRTVEEYQAYLKTRTNSLHFSMFAAFMCIVSALIDFLLWFMLSFKLVLDAGVDLDETEYAVDIYNYYSDIVWNWGFGKSASLLYMIPILLLFSYTRSYRNRMVDFLIPVVAVGIIILVNFEGFYQEIVYFFNHSDYFLSKLFDFGDADGFVEITGMILK